MNRCRWGPPEHSLAESVWHKACGEQKQRSEPEARYWPRSRPPRAFGRSWVFLSLFLCLFDLFQSLMTVVPPRIELGFIRVNGGFLLMGMPMNREAFIFPTPNCAFATFQVGGDLLPGIQAFA